LRRIAVTLGLVATALLASCAGGAGSAPPPDGLEARLRSSDPLHPAFERFLDREPDLFECILAIDSFVYPEIDPSAVRRVFQGLCDEARSELGRQPEEAGPDALAAIFLKTLDQRHFVYSMVPPRHPGEPDASVVSYTLLRGRGSCGTFSLLCAAFLRKMGIESWIVCLPDHCFVRAGRGALQVDIEATDFESPLRPLAGPGPSAQVGTHCGRSLEPSQIAWHYFVDRLWCWVRWRVTDGYALRALERAKTILGSTCQALEAQEARRRALMGASRVPKS
jgi:hypothetical protein